MAEKGTSRTSVGVRPAHRERTPPSQSRGRREADWAADAAADAVPAAVPDGGGVAADAADADGGDGECPDAAGFDETDVA